jgi:uncharacterized protein (TIGR03118 family)
MVKVGTVSFAKSLTVAIAGLSISFIGAAQQPTPTQHYKQTNLVADMPGVAQATDPNLVNPWGLSRSSSSPWWVSDNGPGLATLYAGTGMAASLVVTIPAGDGNGGAGTPTGQIYNGTTGFQIAPGKPAVFMFVTEDGTLSGWNPGVNATSAVIAVNTKGSSVFKGLAIASVEDRHQGPVDFLYVADFRKGRVNVYDANFSRIHLDEDAFEDRRLPKGFAPFNVQNIGGNIYVAFAKQDGAKHDEVDGPGMGYVDVFSPTGRLLLRMESGNWFNAPWGMVQAPSDFGAYSHDILIGQFGSGEILAFDPVTGEFKGRLFNAANSRIVIDGLWDLAFGSGAASGPATTLYFTAGSDQEQHGLFGTITSIENVLGGDQ